MSAILHLPIIKNLHNLGSGFSKLFIEPLNSFKEG